jgi:dTDP-4-amino-4,6-dideoxygalactose transaminase
LSVTSQLLAIEGGSPTIEPGRHRHWPDITPEDHAAVGRVLESGELWGAYGTEVTALQEEWAEFCGAKYCLAVNSGTAALHCACVAVGVGPGDEVIVPAFSFVATPMSVLHAGATPVFCDIEPEMFNIDLAKVEALITERTRALMPVHIHGVVAEMDALQEIADRHGLAIIEDAAQAHGATYNGRNAGTLGECAAFSLNGAKNLSAGEGGLFVTDDRDAYRAATRLAIFGEDTPRPGPGEFRSFWSHGIGWNYRTQELTAALARSQLTRLADYNATAHRNAEILTRGLTALPGIVPPHVPENRTSVYHRYRIRIDAKALDYEADPIELRDRMLYALRAEGVAASTWQLLPLPALPAFRRANPAPWRPDADEQPLEPWRPDHYPETTRLLNESLVLGPETQPLYVQDGELMALYVEAVQKVLARLDAVLHAEPRPVRVCPPIPQAQL